MPSDISEVNEAPAKAPHTQELELPETMFVRDIENRVFQAIVVQCLAKIHGIALMEGRFIDSFLGRGGKEGIKGIHAEQDPKDHTVCVRLEVRIAYGIPIPKKADEIQTKVAEELSDMTGLHVRKVHVVFKDVVLEDPERLLITADQVMEVEPALITDQPDGE